MLDVERVHDLLLEWEAAWRAGQPVEPENLCPDSPEGQAELRRRADLLRKFEAAFSPEETVPERPYPALVSPPSIPGCSIRGELGRGGMGVVYRAWQEQLGREVAVKVLKGGSNVPPEEVRRFAREARLLAQLRHDHIVPLYAAELHLGQPYFVMELVPGGSLAGAVKRFVGDPSASAQLVEQVASAVQYAHEQGVLHRDLKPANILLDVRGRPCVSDFGLAKLLRATPDEAANDAVGSRGEPPEQTLTADGVMMGTPPYMAPEQFRGDATAITARTDVWALGVILYELLTGRRPFTGASTHAFARSVCDDTPPTPRSLRPELAPALEAIVLRCLEKDPARRYATAVALADDLARWRRGDAPLAYSEPWRDRLWRRVRPRLALVTAVALAAVVLTITAAALWINRHLSDPERVRERVRRDLAAGRPVTFVRDSGPPIRYELALGASEAKVSSEPDRPFLVSTLEAALVELWGDPPQSYRFRADIRHDGHRRGGSVGLYIGRRQPGPTAPYPSCYVVSFLDPALILNPGNRETSRVGLGFHFFQPNPKGEPIEGVQQLVSKPLPPVDSVFPSWCSLEVRVLPTAIEIDWQNEKGLTTRIERFGQDQFEFHVNILHMMCPPMNAYTFDPICRGAIGLYVKNGAASFRNVRLEPLQSVP